MSAQNKEKKKLLQNACHVCDKKACQAACLVCNVAFHTRCDPHDPCPNAPEPVGIGRLNPNLHIAKDCAGVCMPKRLIVVAQMKCAVVAIASMRFPKFFSVHNISLANNTKLGLNQPPPPKGFANGHHQSCSGR